MPLRIATVLLSLVGGGAALQRAQALQAQPVQGPRDKPREGCGIVAVATGRRYHSCLAEAARMFGSIPREMPRSWCKARPAQRLPHTVLYTDKKRMRHARKRLRNSNVSDVAVVDIASVVAAGASFGARDTIKPRYRGVLGKLEVLRGAPFDHTLYIDTDVEVCARSIILDTFASLADHDLFVQKAPHPYGASKGNASYHSGFRHELAQEEAREWARFPERNTGYMALNYQSPSVVQLVSDYYDIFYWQLQRQNGRAVAHDQEAFREALFTYRAATSEDFCSPDRCCRGHATKECGIVHGRHTGCI